MAPKAAAKASDAELLDLLTTIAAAYRDTQSSGKELLARRNEVFAELVGRGVTQVEMARRAGITPMAVAFALRPPERKRAKRHPGP